MYLNFSNRYYIIAWNSLKYGKENPMRKSIGFGYFGALFCALMVMGAPAAQASATCFCKISYNDLGGATSASGVCKDLTADVNTSYSGLTQQSAANQNDCTNKCNAKAMPYHANQAIASCACAAGAVTNTIVRAYAGVGTKAYASADTIGVLVDHPAVTTVVYTCPATWLADATNVAGGVTTTGKCKKLSAQPMTITPVPANGTAVGSYGFTWGNALWAWGTAANGGAPTAVSHTTAAVCHF
jgi:hypothetical protein